VTVFFNEKGHVANLPEEDVCRAAAAMTRQTRYTVTSTIVLRQGNKIKSWPDRHDWIPFKPSRRLGSESWSLMGIDLKKKS
jgi:hypothetical protein